MPLARVRPEITDGWTAAVEVVGSGADLGSVNSAPIAADDEAERRGRVARATARGAVARHVRTVDGHGRAVPGGQSLGPTGRPAERQATPLSGATA